MKIAIIGQGATGIMTMRHLVTKNCLPIKSLDLFEKNEIGGLAYTSSQSQRHLMNGPIWNMSLDPNDATHLLRWLNQNTKKQHWPEDYRHLTWKGNDFCPRQLYGYYLKDHWELSVAEAREKGIIVKLIKEEVSELDKSSG